MCRSLARGAMALLGLAPAAIAAAQERPTVTIAPMIQRWSFSTPLPDATLSVSSITQSVLPVGVVLALGEHWTADVAAAYARSEVELDDGSRLSLDGPADVRVRLTGGFADDRLLLTAGVNVPTGKSRLTGEELQAQLVIGAPVFRLAVPALGTGFGATLGAVTARRAGPWAFALGASYEVRGTYQPVEVAVTGSDLTTDLDPGDALHVSLGADRLIGAHRLALLVVGDVYTDDKLTAGLGTDRETSTYHVGPTLLAGLRLDVAAQNFREFAVLAQARYRSSFTDVNGQTVGGSSGTGGDLGVHAILGRPRSLGVIVRADAMIESGLEVDNSLATAGATVGGATLGLSIPVGNGYLEPFARWQFGHFDTGPASTSATSLSFGASLVVR